MKITEFKRVEQVEESLLGSIFGDTGAQTIKDKLGKTFGGEKQHAATTQQNFVNTFVKSALTALKNAPAAPAAPAAQPAANSVQGAASTDPYEKLKGQVRQVQSAQGAKPLPANMVASLQSDMQKLAKGDKESGTFAANKILKFANAGYDVSKLAPTWAASSKAGERFLTQSVYRAISGMLNEHGLTWANLGLRIRLTESVKGHGVFLSTCQPSTVVVSSYDKLNYVFESIMTEYDYDPTLARATGNAPKPITNPAAAAPAAATTAANPAAAAPAAATTAANPAAAAPAAATTAANPAATAATLQTWFNNYMKGVSLDENQTGLVRKLIAGYSKTRDTKILQQLGLLAYKLTVASHPEAAKPTVNPVATAATKPQDQITADAAKMTAQQQQAHIDALRKANPNLN